MCHALLVCTTSRHPPGSPHGPGSSPARAPHQREPACGGHAGAALSRLPTGAETRGSWVLPPLSVKNRVGPNPGLGATGCMRGQVTAPSRPPQAHLGYGSPWTLRVPVSLCSICYWDGGWGGRQKWGGGAPISLSIPAYAGKGGVTPFHSWGGQGPGRRCDSATGPGQ